MFQTEVPLGEEHQVEVVVDPNVAGSNAIHVFAVDDTGRPSTRIEDLGPIEITPFTAGPGHWATTTDELRFPGDWEVRVIGGLDRFTEVDARTVVPIGGFSTVRSADRNRSRHQEASMSTPTLRIRSRHLRTAVVWTGPLAWPLLPAAVASAHGCGAEGDGEGADTREVADHDGYDHDGEVSDGRAAVIGLGVGGARRQLPERRNRP